MLQCQIRNSLRSYIPLVFRDKKNILLSGYQNHGRLLSVSAVKMNEKINEIESVDLINKESATNDSIFSSGGESLLTSAPVTPTEVSSLEPAFSSLGLAHGYPSGWAQALMEVLHISADLSWVQTIGVTTILLRVCVLPIMVSAQKAIVNQNKHLVRIIFIMDIS